MQKRKATRAWLFPGTAAILLGISLAACGSSGGSSGGSAASTAPIKLGQSTSLTGVLAADCAPPSQGLNAWIKYVNSKGGISGRKIDLTTLDDAANPAQAVANVRTFATDGVTAVVGGCGSTTAAAMGPALNKDKIPYLFPDASVPSLASPVLPYVFSLIPQYQDEMPGLVAAAMAKYGPGSNYAMSLEIPGYTTIFSAIASATTAAGGKMAGTLVLTPGPPSVSPYVLDFAKSKAQYLSIVTDSTDGNRIVLAMQAQGDLPKHILGFGGFDSNAYTTGLSAKAQAASLVASAIAPVGASQTSECATAFAKEKVPLNGFTLVGCAQGQAVEATLKAAKGNYSAANIVKTLQGFNNVSIGPEIGPLTYSATDHVGVHQEFLLNISGGTLHIIGTFKDK
jgi:branched-chain amino acid transport system substrate-binding protein